MKKNSTFGLWISVLMHVGIGAALLLVSCEHPTSAPEQQVVEVGFGDGMGSGSGGGSGLGNDMMAEPNPETQPEEAATQAEDKTETNKKEVVTTHSDASDDVSLTKKTGKGQKTVSSGFGNNNMGGSGTGIGSGKGSGIGFDIDWGGKGQRKIYNYNVPEYPAGVNKELDIRIRFAILPDGTVGKIFLLTKGDTRLENAAVSSLRQWRFEPLKPQQSQSEQFVVIVFPFRLQ